VNEQNCTVAEATNVSRQALAELTNEQIPEMVDRNLSKAVSEHIPSLSMRVCEQNTVSDKMTCNSNADILSTNEMPQPCLSTTTLTERNVLPRQFVSISRKITYRWKEVMRYLITGWSLYYKVCFALQCKRFGQLPRLHIQILLFRRFFNP